MWFAWEREENKHSVAGIDTCGLDRKDFAHDRIRWCDACAQSTEASLAELVAESRERERHRTTALADRRCCGGHPVWDGGNY